MGTSIIYCPLLVYIPSPSSFEYIKNKFEGFAEDLISLDAIPFHVIIDATYKMCHFFYKSPYVVLMY